MVPVEIKIAHCFSSLATIIYFWGSNPVVNNSYFISPSIHHVNYTRRRTWTQFSMTKVHLAFVPKVQQQDNSLHKEQGQHDALFQMVMKILLIKPHICLNPLFTEFQPTRDPLSFSVPSNRLYQAIPIVLIQKPNTTVIIWTQRWTLLIVRPVTIRYMRCRVQVQMNLQCFLWIKDSIPDCLPVNIFLIPSNSLF